MPRFTTVIPTAGAAGNTLMLADAAGKMMRQLGVPAPEISAFYGRVMNAESYFQACAIIEEWFPLDHDTSGRRSR